MISTGNSIWSEALFFLFTFAYANSVFDIGWEMCTPRFEFSNLRPVQLVASCNKTFFSLSLSLSSCYASHGITVTAPFTKKASTITGREGRSVVISFSIEFRSWRFLLYWEKTKKLSRWIPRRMNFYFNVDQFRENCLIWSNDSRMKMFILRIN